MLEFVQDDDRVREERKKAKKNRDKYVGIDSESATSSSSRYKSSYNDYSNSNSSNSNRSGGFGKSQSMHNNLDDKDWRSNNPSLQERITDITSKVKTMFEIPDIENNKATYSDDEELGIKNKNSNNNNTSDFAFKDSQVRPTRNLYHV
jgi:hypothetical protein